jgi:hypothetical protein
MDERYRRYYQEAFREEQRYGFRRAAASGVPDFPSVTDAITDAAKTELRPDQVLREDAQLFLQQNMIELVLAPVFATYPPPDPPYPLIKDVTADIKTIVRTASQNTDGVEVTGHSVISAIASMWPELRSLRPEVWG